jgi:hypothetical protein
MYLCIGTWNVRTLHKASNLRALTQQLDLYRLHIVAIQETKWIGNNIWDTKTHTILHSGKQNGKRECGVAFIVDKVTKRNIMAFISNNKRMCTLRKYPHFLNLAIINVHAPTEDSEKTEEEVFYSLLERIYHCTPSNDIKIIIGDLNTKIGREEMFRDITGKKSLI